MANVIKCGMLVGDATRCRLMLGDCPFEGLKRSAKEVAAGASSASDSALNVRSEFNFLIVMLCIYCRDASHSRSASG
jgi:hypothetical protein